MSGNNQKKTAIFTNTAGRTGTASLAELFSLNIPKGFFFHEFGDYETFGFLMPGVAHRMQFNINGNNSYIKGFWKNKAAAIRNMDIDVYGESSHMNFKCGLFENLDYFSDFNPLKIINLSRDTYEIIRSAVIRAGGSYSIANTWMFGNDPKLPRNMVKVAQLEPICGPELAIIFWDVYEALVRMEYYHRRFKDDPRVQFFFIETKDLSNAHKMCDLFNFIQPDRGLKVEDIKLIPPKNTNEAKPKLNDASEAALRGLYDAIKFDAGKIAQEYIDGKIDFEFHVKEPKYLVNQ